MRILTLELLRGAVYIERSQQSHQSILVIRFHFHVSRRIVFLSICRRVKSIVSCHRFISTILISAFIFLEAHIEVLMTNVPTTFPNSITTIYLVVYIHFNNWWYFPLNK